MNTFLITVFLSLATTCYAKAAGQQKPSNEDTSQADVTVYASRCNLCVGLTGGAAGSEGCSSRNMYPPQLQDSQEYLTVKVSQGSLQGVKVKSKKTGGQYYSFKGIPYAQPPVGDFRFKAPKEALSWTGVRNATSEGSLCPQLYSGEVVGSEDCLYLNVYTPQVSNSTLPVMVWIHGGGFTTGSGNSDVYGPDFLVNKGVVLVTINYRLGVLGFLGLNHSLVSQNNGLKDQMAALKWVQANIAQFGGDKDQVTIFGQSAGAASVELHILSPATKGLFQRAISESGSAIELWSYVEPSSARQQAFRMGQVLGLTTDDGDALVKFLNAASVEDLIKYQTSTLTMQDLLLKSANIPFRPTKEEDVADRFLPDSPLNILKSGNYKKVPYITGFNSAEAKLFSFAFLRNETLWQLLPYFMEQFVPSELGLAQGSSESLALAAKIKKLYFKDDAPTSKDIHALVKLLSDAFIVEGVRRSIRHHLTTSSSPVYVYQLSYVGSLSLSQLCNFGYPFRGASHADDLGYLFSILTDDPKLNSTDTATRNSLTTMWTNFAKTGNPSKGLNIVWDPFTTSNQKYLNIDAKLSTSNLEKLNTERFALWDKIYAAIDN